MDGNDLEETTLDNLSIEPKNVFGLQSEIKGNVHFSLDEEVIYPVAGVLAFHNFKKNEQKLLRFPENYFIEIIALSPNRKLIGIAEKINEKNSISIYELPSQKKRISFNEPIKHQFNQILFISFVYNSKGITVLSKDNQDTYLTIFYFDKNETIINGRVLKYQEKGDIKFLACNPFDTGLVALAGNLNLKIVSKSNEKQEDFQQLTKLTGENMILTSLMWLTSNVLIVGTSDSNLIIIESGKPRAKLSAKETTQLDLTKLNE